MDNERPSLTEQSSMEASKDAPLATDSLFTTKAETGKAESAVPAAPAAPVPVSMPDGGTLAWIKVFGSCLIFLNSWGPVLSFGVFQDYYAEHFLTNYSSSDVAWISTVAAWLLLLVGIISGPAYDYGYYRWLVVGGSFFMVFGLMMLSLATRYYEIFLTQGVCLGIGAGLLFTPSVADLAVRFKTKRVLVNAIATAGSNIGGLIYPVIFRQLLPQVGFGWAVRIMGFVALFGLGCALPIMLFKVPPSSGKIRRLVDPAFFKNVPCLLFAIGAFFVQLSYYNPFTFAAVFATQSLHSSQEFAFYTIAVINAGGILGRVCMGLFGDKVGPMPSLIIGAAGLALMSLTWIAVHSNAGLYVWSVFDGSFTALITATVAPCVAYLSPSLKVVGTWMGMMWFLAALGSLFGPPIAGAILQATGKFWPMQLFSGLILVLAVILLLASWTIHRVQLKRSSA